MSTKAGRFCSGQPVSLHRSDDSVPCFDMVVVERRKKSENGSFEHSADGDADLPRTFEQAQKKKPAGGSGGKPFRKFSERCGATELMVRVEAVAFRHSYLAAS